MKKNANWTWGTYSEYIDGGRVKGTMFLLFNEDGCMFTRTSGQIYGEIEKKYYLKPGEAPILWSHYQCIDRNNGIITICHTFHQRNGRLLEVSKTYYKKTADCKLVTLSRIKETF